MPKLVGTVVLEILSGIFLLIYTFVCGIVSLPVASTRWIFNPARRFKDYYWETFMALMSLVFPDFGR